MSASSTVTFWHWLTGQSLPTEAMAAAGPASEERRVWLRHAANLNVHCEPVREEADSGVYAVVCDISRGGIQLIAPCRFEPGSLLSVEIPATHGEKGLAVLACVVRARPHGDSEWSMGCRFSSELHDDQLQAFGAARARPSSPDPRGWSRFPCETKAFYQRVSGDDQDRRSARVLNISVGGVALQVDEPVALGELLSTELHDSTGRPVVTLLACVVHVQSVAEGQLLGCNFIRELNEQDVRVLL